MKKVARLVLKDMWASALDAIPPKESLLAGALVAAATWLVVLLLLAASWEDAWVAATSFGLMAAGLHWTWRGGRKGQGEDDPE